MQILRIATRKSQLAIAQTNFVKAQLAKMFPKLHIEVVKVTTAGDKIIDKPLYEVGGKGLFVKEVEECLLQNKADLAVHSLKDLPAQNTEQLMLAAMLQRVDPRDVIITKDGKKLHKETTATIGTASLRRQAQLRQMYPNCKLVTLRGNIDTRVAKLHQGTDLDAIVLAAAGLVRLNLLHLIAEYLNENDFIPAVSQGVLAVQCRSCDQSLIKMISALNDHNTAICVAAERKFNEVLDGGCHIPIAGFAKISGDKLQMCGMLERDDKIAYVRGEAKLSEAKQLGEQLAMQLLAK